MNNKYTKRYNLTRNQRNTKATMKYNFSLYKLENMVFNLYRI